ncbi:MmgE/PrpD family protein [Sphingomonas sp.]|uniref:MmgE/PrpD family protein n=1 Tax=Sphingomonas sp. TaxID=28214 RepID=UPI002DB6F7AF|nr:MmgE/PrpD family protein [Sphingomonas sp.]HEU4970204.1 MmgE/PrpD family protein [Sphingomonas sp.]
MSATAALLDFAVAPHVLPPQARADAERLLADTLAVGAAGATAPGAEGVRKAAAGWGASDEARVIGFSQRLPAASAAFANAFQIHCLEWDAVHEPAVVHALSVVTGALLATRDRRGGSTPDEALTALAVGVDIASGLGLAADSALSFFRPATAGCIGAALAAARLEGVARERLPDVLGLAYSFCAGTMQAHVEGSIALPLQIANAARAAITAVDLARAGLTGPHDALEGPFGYFTLFDQGSLSRYTDKLGRVWRISEISTKPYPSGRASHAVLSTLAALRKDGKIARVEAHVPPLIARLVGRPPQPGMTPAYARLCLPLLTELMIEDGRIDPRRFADLPAIPPDRFRILVDGNPDLNALSPQRVIVTYADGRRVDRTVPNTLGSPDAPFSSEQAAAKRNLARELAPPEADSRIFDHPLDYFTDPQ